MILQTVRTGYPEYAGMSYEAASREAERLMKRSGWYQNFDRLAALKEIMDRQGSLEAINFPRQK